MDGASHPMTKPIKAQTGTGAGDMYNCECPAAGITGTSQEQGQCEQDNPVPADLFLTWKKQTVSTICDKLSSTQRSTFLFELLGRLPTNNRLYLVRNIDKIATIDFISELPIELSLAVLSLLDPVSLFTAAQVSKYWLKLINSECNLWRHACMSYRITLPYTLPQQALYYKDKALTYLTYLTKLKHKTGGCTTRSVSDATSSLAHMNRALGLAANSTRIYSGGDDRHLRSWDRTTHEMLGDREGMSTSCLDCTESMVAAGLYNGCIMVFNSDISRVVTTCSRHMGPVYDVKWSSDSATVVSGSSDCTVRVWDISEHDNTCRHVFRGHDTMINKLLLFWEETQPRIFSLDIATINVWCVEGKKKLHSLRPLSCAGKEGYFQPGLIHARNLQNDMTLRDIIVCGSSHGIYVWDSNTYVLLRLIKSQGYVCAEHIVGVGSAFIATTYDDGVAMINMVSGEHECTIAVPQFNNTNCGMWLNKQSSWLDGIFEDVTNAIFIVTTFAGDITSFYLNNNTSATKSNNEATVVECT